MTDNPKSTFARRVRASRPRDKRYDILDDIAYVRKDQAETSVLFELISSRYENRSLLVTANQPFGEWGSIFPEQAMTLAAIDRLVHRATIFELNVESYRRRTAVETKRGRGRIGYVRDGSSIDMTLKVFLSQTKNLQSQRYRVEALPIPVGSGWCDLAYTRHGRNFVYASQSPPNSPGPISIWHLWLV